MEIRNLRLQDIPSALSLINDEGWNYTAVELERMLRLDPDGSFVCEDGSPIGIIMSVSYGRTGVIGHLVVSKKGRGRRIGQTLLERGLDYFNEVGTDSIILYATEAGERLYGKNGFVVKGQAFCVNAKLPRVVQSSEGALALPLKKQDVADVIALDSELFGDNRGKLIELLCKEHVNRGFKIERGGELQGFIMARESPVGYDIGPWLCKSGNPADAMNLFAAEVSTFSYGSMFIGAFAKNEHAVANASNLKMNMQWRLKLMVRGKGRYEADLSKVYGIAAFELG